MATDDEIRAALMETGAEVQRAVDRVVGDPHRHCREMERLKDAEIARLRAALRPFAEFAKAFNANPCKGVDDALYSIHGGAGAPSGKGADLRLSDCRAALKALGEET